MENNNLLEVLTKMLAIEKPWYLESTKIQKTTKVVDIHIGFERGSKFKCSQCNKECNIYDSSPRRIRHLDIFDFRCYLNIKVPRVKCDDHGVKTIGSTVLFRQGSHYSYLLENKIMRLCAEMSMSAISKEIGEPDNNLWRVFHHYIKMGIEHSIELSTTARIAVDETASKRGHNYVSVFTDMDSGDVILVEEGRTKDVFSKLYGWLFDKGGHPKNIELFSMDMSKSYKAGRKENFAHSQEVYDRFHIKKALNEAVNDVRKKEVVHCEELKKTKYIWLKNERNLKVEEKKKLTDFLEEGSYETAIAYQLKTSFDQLWKVQSKAVEPLLKQWLQAAIDTTLKPLNEFVNTVINNYDGIIMSFKTGITNAISEGINSVIQLARTRARGFRNIGNFKAMIYFLGNQQIYDIHT
jgi:transposase